MFTLLANIRSSRFGIFVSHHWLTIAFGLGFFTDLVLLNQIDNTFDNLILLFYVLLATTSLLLFYVAVSDRGPFKVVRFLTWFTPITMQYSFGGLLSGMLIFYGRSGDLITSAPFLLIIISVIFMNEMVERRSDRLIYNISVYFIGLFSYCVLVVPVILGKMNDYVFVGSGLVALLVIFLVVKFLSIIIPNFLVMQLRLIVFSVGCLYAMFNAFYFINIIPPIPLSLTELSIYQKVERFPEGIYHITKEDLSWYRQIPGFKEDFHPIPGFGATCFARVYAPTSLKTKVVHRWEFLDASGAWQEKFSLAYGITGENKNGYRGFTTSLNVVSGKWRCSVENERGQVLGRRTFTIDTTVLPQHLVTVVE